MVLKNQFLFCPGHLSGVVKWTVLLGGIVAAPIDVLASSSSEKSQWEKSSPAVISQVFSAPARSRPPAIEEAIARSRTAPPSLHRPQRTDIAAPENLNPGLYVPPPIPEGLPSAPIPAEPQIPDAEEPEVPFTPLWQIENLTVDFSDDFNNFDQNNRLIEPTVSGVLPNGDRLGLTTGLNTFTQPEEDAVLNWPLQLIWSREMGDFTTTVGGGIDVFDQLPLALNLEANTAVPLGQQATLSFFVEQGPYKFNAMALNQQVASWRYGPNLYWQLAPDTSFFSLVRWGRYNDGNREQQSFSRLEHQVGEFAIAANLFNWRYREDLEETSGYFSPPDFLVLNGELAWEGSVSDWLDCRIAASWGQQRLIGDWTPAFGYGTQCTFQVTDSTEIDLGYSFDNVIGQTGGSAYNNRSISGQLRMNF